MGIPFRHVLLIVFNLSSVFLFSGIIYGWAPLNSILISEDFYRHLCKPGDEVPCQEQAELVDGDACVVLALFCAKPNFKMLGNSANALNLAFTFASTAVSLVAIPAGFIVDRYGPMVGSIIAGVLELGGLAGIAICEDVFARTHFDLFLVSCTTIAVGGSLTMFSAYSMPFLFPRRATLIIELTSCLFDASCIIFSVFKLLRDATGLEFSTTWWAYVGIGVFVYSMLVFAWCLNRKELAESRSRTSDSRVSTTLAHNSTKLISSQPILKQLRSVEFVAVCLYAAVQVARSNLYLGTVDLTNRQWARKAGWKSELSWVTTAVGLIVPFGFFFVPLIECSIHRLGLINTFHVTSIVGILYNVLQLTPSLYAQLLGAVVFAAFRAFLFSIISAFNAATFGPVTMGRVMGLCFLASAIVNLSQSPLVNYSLSLKPPTGDFVPVLIGSILVSTVPALFWFVVMLVQRRRRRMASAWAATLLENAVEAGQDGSVQDTQNGQNGQHGGARRGSGEIGGGDGGGGYDPAYEQPIWKSHATAVGASPDSWNLRLSLVLEEEVAAAAARAEAAAAEGAAPVLAVNGGDHAE